jgi:hypothetical protein
VVVATVLVLSDFLPFVNTAKNTIYSPRYRIVNLRVSMRAVTWDAVKVYTSLFYIPWCTPRPPLPLPHNCFQCLFTIYPYRVQIFRAHETPGRFHSRQECSNRGVIRALPPAFVGNCPRGHCEQEWYKTPSLSKSTSLKSAFPVTKKPGRLYKVET